MADLPLQSISTVHPSLQEHADLDCDQSFPWGHYDRTPQSCTCHIEELLLDCSKLERGDHITRDLNKGCNCSIPSHHAIFLSKKGEVAKDGTVKLELAHYVWEEEIFTAKISDEDFNFGKKDVYKVKYYHPRYKGDDVAQNARNQIDKRPKYKYLDYNCEHFCVECVTGQKSSSQVENLAECTNNCFHGITRLVYCIFAILSFAPAVADDISGGLTHYKGAIPGWVLITQCIGLICYQCIIFAPCIRSCLKFNDGNRCKTCIYISFLKLISRLVYVLLTVYGIIVSFFHNNRIRAEQNISDKEACDFKIKSILITVISLFYIAGIELFFKCSLKCRRKWFKCCSRSDSDCCGGCARKCIEERCCFADNCIKKPIRCCVNCCATSPCNSIALLIQIIFASAANIPDFVYVMTQTSESVNGNVFDWLIIIKCVSLALYLQTIFCPLIYALIQYMKDNSRKTIRTISIVKFLFRFIAVFINIGGICVLIIHDNAIKKNKSLQDAEYSTLQYQMQLCFELFISYVLVVETFIRICECVWKCCSRRKDGCKCPP